MSKKDLNEEEITQARPLECEKLSYKVAGLCLF